MNLNRFLGQMVVVQFKAPDAFAMVRSEGGALAPMAMKTSNGGLQLVSMPFIIGKILKQDEDFVVIFKDDNKNELEATIDPATVFTVTRILEAPRVQLIG